MSVYCILNSENIVVNTVLWDGVSEYNVEDDHSLIPLQENEIAGIGWKLLDNNIWQPPKPYESWLWVNEEWVAPIPKPQNGFQWNEEMLQWQESS